MSIGGFFEKIWKFIEAAMAARELGEMAGVVKNSGEKKEGDKKVRWGGFTVEDELNFMIAMYKTLPEDEKESPIDPQIDKRIDAVLGTLSEHQQKQIKSMMGCRISTTPEKRNENHDGFQARKVFAHKIIHDGEEGLRAFILNNAIVSEPQKAIVQVVSGVENLVIDGMTHLGITDEKCDQHVIDTLNRTAKHKAERLAKKAQRYGINIAP